MNQTEFKEEDLKKLWRPENLANKFGTGQVAIVGGSELFHGAPILALKAASRVVSMVYFSTPDCHRTVVELIKSQLGAFIFVPFEEIEDYISKSDSVLIGPGMMRNRRERDGYVCDDAGRKTKLFTEKLLLKFSDKRWVIDGGSLQVIDKSCIPSGAILTPNRREMEILLGKKLDDGVVDEELVVSLAESLNVVIVYKSEVTLVSDGKSLVRVRGGNPGLIKGAVGDVIAGLTVGLLAKNEPIMAACAASFLVKRAADRLYKRCGEMYNSDDLADEIRLVYGEIVV